MQLSTYRGIVSRHGDFYSEIAEVPGTHWREMEDDRGPLLLREGKRYGGERGIRAMGGQWRRARKGERERKGKRVRKGGKQHSVGNSTTPFIRMIRQAFYTYLIYTYKTRDFYTTIAQATYSYIHILDNNSWNCEKEQNRDKEYDNANGTFSSFLFAFLFRCFLLEISLSFL